MEPKVQSYVLNLPDEKRELMLQVRDLFLLTDASISEAIKWNNLTFSVGKNSFAFIYTYKHVDYINVAFFFATKLSDPKNLFDGTGKTMRHIKVKTAKDVPAAQIKKWIKESLLLKKEIKVGRVNKEKVID